MGETPATDIVPARPKWHFAVDRFRAVDSLDAFAEDVLAGGCSDVIAKIFLKGYKMPALGIEGNPLRECYALNVGLYALELNLKYEQRVGQYASDPGKIGISYDVHEFEIVSKVDPFEPLNEILESGEFRDEAVRVLTSRGIGVFDPTELIAANELAYTPPLSSAMCGYDISFCYDGKEPPFPNGVVHSILPGGSDQHLGVDKRSFDSDEDDWDGEWKPSEAV